MKRLATAALLIAVAAAPGCTTRGPSPMTIPGGPLLQGGTRDAAVCGLLRRGQYAVESPRYRQEVPAGGCRVRALFDDTARPKGSLVTLLEPDWTDPELPNRPDVGVLVIFDRAGRIVPVFEAANYFKGSDGVVKYRHDGAVAVVHQFGYAGDPDWSVEALHVVPATVDQVPILSVLIGAPHRRFPDSEDQSWAWRAHDVDGDGNLDFEVGPSQPDRSLVTKATYRYSAVSHRYDGPAGSLSGDFYLVQPPQAACNWSVAEQFAVAHGFPSTPSQGSCEQQQ